MTRLLSGKLLGMVAIALALAANVRETRAGGAVDLAAQVQIRRTEYGVPHIEAPTLEAVAFGFGYCQAEDHLPNIMRGYITARGELAAAFGPDGDQPDDGVNVKSDAYYRQFRVYQRADDNYDKIDPDYRAMCEGFAAGLNYFVDKHPDSAADWMPKITGRDVVAYGFAGVMRFAFNRGKIINDFLKTQDATAAIFEAESDAELGSNMWAFAPSRSRSGRALLMGNPHQGWRPVSTYYEAHLKVPGKLDFYGSTFIGRPVLTTGWNENLGWSHTVNYPDLEEIYELALDPDKENHYLFDGKSVPITQDDVEIEVKTDDGSETLSRTFWHTPLGPVIHRTADKLYVIRSACYENYRAYEQWLRMSQATSFEEFRQALAMQQIPMFNICYADRTGNIYYLWNGTVPKLPHPAHKAEAVPAEDSSDIWTEFHTLDELPQLFNPPGGYVHNCNSPPYFTNLRVPMNPQDFPGYFPANNVSLRSQHSLRLIDGDHKFTLEEVRDRKHSPDMLLGERVKDDLLATLRAEPSTSELAAGIKALEAWDGTVQADSPGGTLFEAWWKRYEKKGGKNFAEEWDADKPTTTPHGLADKPRAAKAFVEALREVNATYGRPDVSWGEAHRIRYGDVDLPVSGGSGLMGCFRVIGFAEDPDGKLRANTGDSWVFAVEFGQPVKAYTIISYSQSELPDSPHFNDQAPLFSANRMKRAAFTDAEIEAQLIRSYRPGQSD
ncbi:MAG: acylase [Planctomycetota bacterium]|nr:MAG: acylase [Planctomycetota bacterium]